jgi:hypothetical protein
MGISTLKLSGVPLWWIGMAYYATSRKWIKIFWN